MEDPIVVARRRIDEIDRAMVRLLNERARYALAIGRLKRAQGMLVHDPEREEEVLDRVTAESEGPLATSSIRGIFAEVIAACRSLQEQL